MKYLASVFQDLRKQVAPLLKSFQGEVRAYASHGAFDIALHECVVLAVFQHGRVGTEPLSREHGRGSALGHGAVCRVCAQQAKLVKSLLIQHT